MVITVVFHIVQNQIAAIRHTANLPKDSRRFRHSRDRRRGNAESRQDNPALAFLLLVCQNCPVFLPERFHAVTLQNSQRNRRALQAARRCAHNMDIRRQFQPAKRTRTRFTCANHQHAAACNPAVQGISLRLRQSGKINAVCHNHTEIFHQRLAGRKSFPIKKIRSIKSRCLHLIRTLRHHARQNLHILRAFA